MCVKHATVIFDDICPSPYTPAQAESSAVGGQTAGKYIEDGNNSIRGTIMRFWNIHFSTPCFESDRGILRNVELANPTPSRFILQMLLPLTIIRLNGWHSYKKIENWTSE